MALYTDQDTDHDHTILRESDCGDEYTLWVKVDHYIPAEHPSWTNPGAEAEIECKAWNTLRIEEDLSEDEVAEILELHEGGQFTMAAC